MRKTFLSLAFILSASAAFAGAPRASDLPEINGGKAPVSVQAQCGAAWRADKAALSAKGYTWPAYYSACARVMREERKASAAPAPAVVACTTDTDCLAKNPGVPER